MTRLYSILIAFACGYFLPQLLPPAYGQDWSLSNGVLHITDWPSSEDDIVSLDSLKAHAEILPSIDTLSVGYGYRSTRQQPFLTFAVEWKPGDAVYMDGNKLAFSDLQGEVNIESLHLRVDVLVEEDVVSQVDFVVDSLMLPPYPGLFSMEVNTLGWDTVFPGVPDSTAQSYFASSFELGNPRIVNMTFVYFGEEPVLTRSSRPQAGSRRPRRQTVYGPSVDVIIDIPIYISRPPRYVGDASRTREPRGERTGRGAAPDDEEPRSREDRRNRRPADEEQGGDEAGGAIEDITSGRSRKKDDDDDDDDDDELLPVALAGAAAVAIVAVAGGTVGYYGNTKFAPIGLSAGYVQPEGGFLLQVAVNEAVINRSTVENEHIIGRLVSFYDVFKSPVQPMVGLGAMMTELNGDRDFEFSASVGLVGNFGPLIVLGGYDVTAGGVDLGVAYNFKARRQNNRP